MIGCWLVCLCVLLKNICTVDTVYPQFKLEGLTGDSVVLPCESSKNEQNLQDINVLWRYNYSANVLAIINGKDSVEHQNPKFKNRIKTFPKEYEKGNFNLTLDSLTQTDTGAYQCYIKHSAELVTVQLLVNESPKPSDVEGGKWTILISIGIVFFSVVFIIIIIVCIVVKKRCSKTFSSGESSTAACLPCPVSFKPISNTHEPTSQNHQDYSGLSANI